MKKVLVLVGALILSGCATTGGQVDLKAIQSQVAAACSFVPTVQVIAQILNRGATALTVVSEICAAVTSVPLADGGSRKVVVRGVPVAGRKIR